MSVSARKNGDDNSMKTTKGSEYGFRRESNLEGERRNCQCGNYVVGQI